MHVAATLSGAAGTVNPISYRLLTVVVKGVRVLCWEWRWGHPATCRPID